MFTTQPVDEGFFDSAPVRLVGTFDVPRPAAEVWSELTGDRALHWCRIIQRVTWTSPPPYGVGTTRTVRALGGANVIDEHFFRWEEGRRHSFYALQTSAPMWRSFAEDYLVEPASETSCRFEWTIAFEPRKAARPANPMNRLILGTLFRDTRRYYGAR
jgi:hypothetical protein